MAGVCFWIMENTGPSEQIMMNEMDGHVAHTGEKINIVLGFSVET
jgi:hypothetical protein